MSIITKLIDFALHIDKYLGILIQMYGLWIYAILFLIIFLETGLVFTPFLPGDSLLFVTGTYAGSGMINLPVIIILFIVAAVLGDAVNFYIGKKFGILIFEKNKLVNIKYYEKTQKFYNKHGGKTIILARFIPIVRTFAPFVAGISKMKYLRFLSYNIIGGIVWVLVFVLSGYFFGKITFVEQNLTLVTYIIILISFIPAVIEFVRHYLN